MPALKYIPNYTVQEYRQWEGDWELWDGIPVSMSPNLLHRHSPFGRHQWAATSIASAIKQQLDELDCADCYVLMETDWNINQRTVVRPDLSVCCGAFPEKFIESAPALVVEVLSESTADKDKHSKRLLYESEGVSDYLMLDLIAERFIHYQLDSGAYIEQPSDEPVLITLHPGCRVELSVPKMKK